MPRLSDYIYAVLLITALTFAQACRSTAGAKEPAKVTLDQFHELDWQRQVEEIEGITRSNRTKDDEQILAAALSDDDDAVIIAGLEAVLRLDRDEFLPRVIELLDNTDPIIRWRAILIVEKMISDSELLPRVAKLINDKEWLVREAAYRALRNFKAERGNKTYFYSIMFHLTEKNPQVVTEIYRTLVWYDDESAWPYLIKRSYHCKSASELIMVMRELARTKARDAQVRLKTLTRSQSAIVRQEATSLLREYF